MGQINLPSLDDITQIKDPKQQMEALINTVGLLMKSLTEINGYLSSKNIFEVGDWRVNNTELVSKDGAVGMSTEDTAGDDVRFWAGGPAKDIAPWRVYESGKGVATGWTIQSKSGSYPKIVVDPDSELFGAYSSSNTYVQVMALDAILGFSPGIRYESPMGTGLMYLNSSGVLEIRSTNGIELDSSGMDIKLSGDVLVPSGSAFFSSFSNIYGAGVSLQTALDSKADAGHTHTVTIDGVTYTVS